MTMKRAIKTKPKAVEPLYVVFNVQAGELLNEYPLTLKECSKLIEDRLDDVDEYFAADDLVLYQTTNLRVKITRSVEIIEG